MKLIKENSIFVRIRVNIVPICLGSFAVFSLILFCFSFGYSYLIPLLFIFLGAHLVVFNKADFKMCANLGLLLILVIVASHAVNMSLPLSKVSPYYVPVASIAMLTMLLFNDVKLSFIMAFASSVLSSIILGGDFGMMLTFFIGSLVGTYSVKEARTREQVFSAGLFVSVLQLVCLYLINPDVQLILSAEFKVKFLYPLAFNGFISVILVVGTLGIFEYLFNVLTNFKLLEIADNNQPLLKRMALEAPGTWQHSLSVSQLSEAAADAIGANTLLARAGAYYHDIGKMIKPEYFTENQLMGANKHDYIEPSMSKLVILNHVKEGIELAKKNKINPKIIDFIPQHHGTSIIYYFYQNS